MNYTDVEREKRINKAYQDLVAAPDVEALKEASDRMLAEIRQRSAERIAEMELQKGLQ